MPLLHIVNRSPFENTALHSCLRLAKRGSGILLFEDGVLAALRGGAFEAPLTERMLDCPLYVLRPDLQARGVSEAQVIDGASLVDYPGFVDLVCEYDGSLSWL